MEWVEKRVMGLATTEREYADACSSEWISRLRKSLAIHWKKFGVEEFDASVLQQTAPRILTQFVSRIVFNSGLAGIYYRSKYGHDIENWVSGVKHSFRSGVLIVAHQLGSVRTLPNQRPGTRAHSTR